MKGYRMALDQGTTSSRCIIFDYDGNVVASASREFAQHFPAPGWVEHDALDILSSQLTAAREALERSGLSATDIAAIGITNQRETTILWDKHSGMPICPAIVWQCRRTAPLCDQLRADGCEEMIRSRTGLPIDPYFSATKLVWMLDNIPGARERAERGELLFGTVDSFLIYHLTGGRVHATDPSNAARTLLYNIHTLTFDAELLRLFRIPSCILPKVLPSAGHFGETDASVFGAPIPITGVAGDQQAALFGQCCFEAGMAKNTYGTGGFLLMNTGSTPVRSAHGLLTTVGWQIGNEVSYVLEGSVFVCGAALQWLRDGLGITRGTTRAHIVRATLEAMAFQTVDVLDAMREDAGTPPKALRVDGGASANALLLSLQSDLSGLLIHRPACIETTALGAANLAGLAAGVYSDLSEIAAHSRIAATFSPAIDETERQERLAKWHKAVEATRTFV